MMFSGAASFDMDGGGIDDFIHILEGDDERAFKKMFRDMGKGYRGKPQKPTKGRARKAGKGDGNGK